MMKKKTKFVWIGAFPFFLVLYEFAVNSSNDMYLPALLDISREFSVSENTVQLTISAWLAGAAFVQLLLGPLSDRTGRRFVLLNGGLFFLLATLGCFLIHSIELFILFRFLQGVGMCTLTAAGYAAIHEFYQEKKAVEILGWVAAVSILAPMLGPFLGGLILTQSHWRIIFLWIFLIAFISWIGLVFSMPETNLTPDPHALRFKNLIASYSRILKTPAFVLGVLSDGFLFGCVMGWITACPFLLMEEYQLSQFQFGLVQVPIFFSYGLGALFVKKLSQSFDLEKIILLGLWIAALGGLFIFVESFFQNLHFTLRMIFPMALLSFGFGLVSAPLTRKTLFATQERLGVSTALLDLGIVGSGAVGSFMVSTFFDDTLPPVASVIFVLAIFSLGMNYLRIYLFKQSLK